MQWVACMVPNTAYTTHQLPAKAVFSSDQRRREGMRRGVKNACCLCFADAAPTLQCCQITALAFQLNQLIQILVRTTCIDPLLKRLILINVWSVHVLSDIILKYSQMIDIFALKPLLSARWWTHPLCLVPTPHQGMESIGNSVVLVLIDHVQAWRSSNLLSLSELLAAICGVGDERCKCTRIGGSKVFWGEIEAHSCWRNRLLFVLLLGPRERVLVGLMVVIITWLHCGHQLSCMRNISATVWVCNLTQEPHMCNFTCVNISAKWKRYKKNTKRNTKAQDKTNYRTQG